jgi:hypothetical protein
MPITPKGVDRDPKKDDYEKEITKLLTEIAGKPVGQVIYDAILLTKKQLTISPESLRPANSYQPDKTYRGTRAATFALDPAAAAPATVSPTGTKLRDKQYAGKDDDDDTETDPATHKGDERYDPVAPKYAAKGGGSDTIIYFTPGAKGDKSCANGSGLCADNPDEVLLHEMVHALRDMQGLFNPVPTVTLRYMNEEEFLAIVVTNVYISKAKGKTFLRPDYRRVGPLQAPSNTSDGFLKDTENKDILDYYSKFWQPVFDQLGKVQTDFNPFSKFTTTSSPSKP